MTDAPETLAGFFAESEKSFSETEADAAVEVTMQREMRGMDDALLEAFSLTAILAMLFQAMNVPLVDILRNAWQSAADLQDYRDPDKHPPGEEKIVKVGKTRLTSTHQPKVDILFNGRPAGALIFDAKLTLNIAGSRFRVRDSRIWEMLGSEFEGECELSYRGFVLVKRKVGKIVLPGGIEFEDGLEIVAMPVLV